MVIGMEITVFLCDIDLVYEFVLLLRGRYVLIGEIWNEEVCWI